MTLFVYFIGILTGIFSAYLACILYKTFKKEPMSGSSTDAAFRQVMRY